jgi:hypothetical protein
MSVDTVRRRSGTPMGAGHGDPLIVWRRRALERAGFEPEAAAVWSACRGLDLHALLTLVDRGCPPPLAARIVAPAEYSGE